MSLRSDYAAEVVFAPPTRARFTVEKVDAAVWAWHVYEMAVSDAAVVSCRCYDSYCEIVDHGRGLAILHRDVHPEEFRGFYALLSRQYPQAVLHVGEYVYAPTDVVEAGRSVMRFKAGKVLPNHVVLRPPRGRVVRYPFATPGERAAFLKGLRAGQDHPEYTLVKENEQ